MAAFPDERGVDTLYVIVKATFAICAAKSSLAIAEEQVPPQAADEYWGEPDTSSLKYSTDMHLPKPTTDVALVGQAWTTDARKKDQVNVLLSVAERSKVLRVFGDRVWIRRLMGCKMSPPEPFESIPLVYERAYGGVHQVDPESETTLAEERNPVGRGFRGKRKAKHMADQLLPNIEDPGRLIRRVGDRDAPQGFGFVAPAWLPRRSFAGTYDEAWQENRAPYLPDDFDSRFFNAAHPDMVFDRYLKGGEPVEVIHASRSGQLKFRLPVCELDVKVAVAGTSEKPAMNLETVLVEPDDDRVSLVWRGGVSCDKKLLRVEEVRIAVDKLEIDGQAA